MSDKINLKDDIEELLEVIQDNPEVAQHSNLIWSIIDQLNEANKVLMEAVEYYGDTGSWNETSVSLRYEQNDIDAEDYEKLGEGESGKPSFYGGKRARKAIQKASDILYSNKE